MKTTSQRMPHDEVVLVGATLKPGWTVRVICPKCGGGTQRETSCAVSKDSKGVVFFKCFRAKCNWGGTISQGLTVADVEALKVKRTRIRTLNDPIEPLDAIQVLWYREKFGVSPDKDTYYCSTKDMYAYKVRGPDGQTRGWQLRSYVPGVTVRALNYIERDEPFMAWYFPKLPEIGGVIIVEDIPSARKCATCGIASVALLGNSIDFERAYEIAGKCENFAIIALDRGTLMQAISFRQMYESLWGSVEIWQLQEDLKYVARTRIREAIFDGKSDFISLFSK